MPMARKMMEGDPAAVEVGTLNPLKDKGLAAAYFVILLCVLFAALQVYIHAT